MQEILRGKEDCSLIEHDNVIKLGHDSDEDKAWVTPQTIEFRELDEEYNRNLKSSFSF